MKTTLWILTFAASALIGTASATEIAPATTPTVSEIGASSAVAEIADERGRRARGRPACASAHAGRRGRRVCRRP